MIKTVSFQQPKSLIRTILASAFLLLSITFSYGQEKVHEEKEESPTAFIMEHIKDAHEWHFTTIGHNHVTIPLPVILFSQDRGLELFMSSAFVNHETHEKQAYNGYILNKNDHIEAKDPSRTVYDFSITKNVAMLFITLLVVYLIMASVAKRYKKYPKSAPKGISSFIEPLIIFIRDDIAKPNIGPRYAKYLPYLLTLFFFILFSNILGLFPGAANLTGNIAVTFTLAIITFVITNINGNKTYWKHVFAMPGVPIPILPIMILVEFIGLFTKPISLMIRLFVAVTAGHIVILSIIGLTFIFESYLVGVASTVLVIFVNVIEVLVAVIQAYIFTLFSSMYIGAAIAEHHDEEHGVDKSLI